MNSDDLSTPLFSVDGSFSESVSIMIDLILT